MTGAADGLAAAVRVFGGPSPGRWLEGLGGELARRTAAVLETLDLPAGPAGRDGLVALVRSARAARLSRIRPDALAAALQAEPPAIADLLTALLPEPSALRVRGLLGLTGRPPRPPSPPTDRWLAELLAERFAWVEPALSAAPAELAALSRMPEESVRQAAHRLGLHEMAVAVANLDAESQAAVLSGLPRADLEPVLRLLRESRPPEKDKVKAAQRNIARADLRTLGSRAFDEVGYRVIVGRVRREPPALAAALTATAPADGFLRRLRAMREEPAGRTSAEPFGTAPAVVREVLLRHRSGEPA